MSIGVPIKVLHEAEGHIITCETNTGEIYRGKLVEAEDNMNCQMTNITCTYRLVRLNLFYLYIYTVEQYILCFQIFVNKRDGRVAQLENVYIRGSKIRFLILPDMLKNAPMFKRQGAKAASSGPSSGRGKSAILRAQGISFRSD